MSVKNKVLHILEFNKGNSVSGQELADTLCVSRTAVWKAINSLKEEGYIINATSNKGYSLSSTSDLLSSEGIKLYLNDAYKDIPVVVHKSLPSTNKQAKLNAMEKSTHGTVVLSEEQTEGRGRFGRDFFSPPETGIYMSIILKPKINISDSVLITTSAAVSVCLAIDKFTDVKPKIKWVNDIYMGNKKVCGILTEAVTDFESGMVDNVIVGIGLNVKTKSETFPKALQEKAGSIFLDVENNCIRNQLAAEIINNILSTSEKLEERDFLKIYKERSMILGKYILYNKNNVWYEGYAQDIDESGGLIVIRNDGKKEILISGEVSIKL